MNNKTVLGKFDLSGAPRPGAGMLAMAVAVGVVGGLGAVVFRKLIALFHNLFFFGRFSGDYNTLLHTAASPWGIGIIAVPVVGSLIVTFLVKNYAPEAKGHGVPEVIYAVHFRRGFIRTPVALVKALASSISIGSGGAVGREGPIIQIGSTFGSVLAKWTRVPEWQRLALIACGGGAGIAATFNTPIGGVLFASEILLVEVSARTLIPVMLATGTASLIGRAFFGNNASFIVPPLTLAHSTLSPGVSLIAYIVLGLLMGVAAAIYTRSIYLFEDSFEKLPGGDYFRHALGMAMVGVIIYLLMTHAGHYYVQGVGYATIQDILNGTLTAGGLLLLLAVLKLLATSLTLGSGASGGVFSPALFIGATLGGAFAAGVHALLPGVDINPANAAVIGMACIVGASTGAAVTAVVMIFEMTRDYHVIIPLIIGVSVAYSVYHLLLSESIYTLKLARRGQRIASIIQSQLYLARGALDFIGKPFICLESDAHLSAVPTQHMAHRKTPRVVLLDDGNLVGVVPAHVLLAAQRWMQPSALLRDLADTHVVVVESSIRVFDLIAVLRRERASNAVMTADGTLKGANSVRGVVTWRDLVETTNLSDYLDHKHTPTA